MIGALVEGKHKKHGPILLISFMNRTPEPICIFMKRDATLGFAPLSEISMDWNWTEKHGFRADSESMTESEP